MTVILTPSELRILAKRPFLSVTQWAAKHLIVMDGPYRGGPLKMDVTPYLKFVMDSFSQKHIEQIVICGSPQTGKTLAMYACMGWCVDRRVGTKMLAMPDDRTVLRVAEEKLKPMFRGSVLLSKIMRGTTQDHIKLDNGTSIFLSSAQAPAQRASISVKDLFMDEEDLYQTIAGKGDPVMDFLERTRSYSFSRKIMRVSKPVGDVKSSIWRALISSNVIYSYEIECPLCGAPQFFQEDGVEVVKHELADPERDDYPDKVVDFDLGRYRCPYCKELYGDLERNRAVNKGRWSPSEIKEMSDLGVPTFSKTAIDPSVARKIGFHLPAILSRAVSLSEIAARKILVEKTGDQEKLQSQANGDWARPYVATTVNPRVAEILDRMDPDLPARTVPRDAVALTMGIDTQKRGFYYLVLAWMPNMTKYVIDYGWLDTFEQVRAQVYDTVYPELDTPNHLDVFRAGIDSGGTATEGTYTRPEEVYEFVWKFGGPKLFACKGAATEVGSTVRFTQITKMPGRKTPIIGGIQLATIDTGKVKSSMFDALLNKETLRPIKLYGHDPERESQEGLHAELAEHLTSERQVKTTQGKLVWKKHKADNHYLDCLMMACACGDVSWTPSVSMLAELKKYETERAAGVAFVKTLNSGDFNPTKRVKKKQRGW